MWAVLDGPQFVATPLPGVDSTRDVAAVAVDRQPIALDRQLAVDGHSGNHMRSLAASLIAAECVGGAAWCVETASEYAKVRVQFGRPIGQFQAVKHRCADMLLRLELAARRAWDAARAAATPMSSIWPNASRPRLPAKPSSTTPRTASRCSAESVTRGSTTRTST